jgi:trans-aconitate 2-methyltransferase
MTQHYTFGDNDRAARRLYALAAAYEPTSAALLQRFAESRPQCAVDLGAGLGLTTRMVHAITGARRTMGLDASARFVAVAAAQAPPGVTYRVHDVTQVPFPFEDAPDFAYARFLLTHLSGPEDVLATWRRGCAPGATLVIEETAELTSDDGVLQRYYAMVDEMQRHYGQALRIGRKLGLLASGAGWRVVDLCVTPVPVSAVRMAGLHVENIRTWKSDPFAAAFFDPAELRAVEGGLEAIATGQAPASVVAAIGQIVAQAPV